MNKKHFYPSVILLLFLVACIQPALATIYIPGSEDYYDIVNGEYVLKESVNLIEMIEIVNDGIILDGNGKTVDGTGTSFYAGVSIISKDNVTIKNLNVTGFPYGIWLADSSNVIVENNNVYSNLNDGISIVTPNALGHYNILSNNTVSNNSYGITLGGNTDYNEIYNNTVSNNGTGIYLCLNAQFNTIYNNNFENTTNASVAGADNVFDDGDPTTGGKGGNYWSNWTTPDNDGDGIVDNPYVMPPYLVDNYPWTIENGWLSPELLIVQLIDTIAEMNLQQGIDNSLDAKLDAAFNALDDVNQNNDVAAINSLNAFKNAVEDQRDNKLTGAQADELIDQADSIIAMLGG